MPDTRPALLAGIGCYTIWGFLPLLYQLMARLGVGSVEMTAHRALWAVLWAGLLVLLARQGPQVLRVLRRPKTVALLTLTSVLIGTNWLIYVWAVSSGRTLEASLGYYINPLMNMAAGALLFRERLDRFAYGAIALAAAGVLVQTLALGHPPWISLSLALLFCAYGVIRKRVDADAQTGLFVECLVLTLPGLAFVLWLEAQGAGHFREGLSTATLLMLNGPATVAPLALFAWAARRLPLSTMGFLQYIGPTLSFCIGLAAGELFTPLRALSFGFIWAGVAVFAYGAWRRTQGLVSGTEPAATIR
jgi:chloramphenicol-sensitive protein RarD